VLAERFQRNPTETVDRLQALLEKHSAILLNEVMGIESGAGTFATVSPVDRSVICAVARGDASDVDAAARAAHDAFPAWRDLPATERRRILVNVADAIEARANEIGRR